MLFDAKDRTDRDSKNHNETNWQYLGRSGRVEAERVRSLLTSWLSSYPEAHRNDIVSRMRGGTTTDFKLQPLVAGAQPASATGWVHEPDRRQ